MSLAYIDANVILRFLVADPPEMAARSAELIQAVERGEVVLRVDDIIVAEVVWVLHSFYRHEPQQIATTLLEFLSQDGIEVNEDVLSALALCAGKGIHFVDALLTVHAQRSGVRQIYSFDRHFDRVAGLERLQPGLAPG